MFSILLWIWSYDICVTFVAVAEELHFGRAAQRLHIAQPPLSQQIKALENELGAQLFSRTKRRVELTAAGELLLEEARLTLEQAARTEKVVKEAEAGIRGRIDVAFVTSASYSVLPDVIRSFRTNHPQIDLSLHEMIPARQLEALERKEIDVGLLRPPVSESCFEIAPILAEPLVAALPANHRLVNRQSISLKSLAEEAFVLFPRKHGPGLYDLIVRACHDAGFTPKMAYEANEMQAILAYVAGGLGVTLVPGSVTGFHLHDIAYRPLKGSRTCIELALIWNPANASKVLETFRSLCSNTGAAFGKDLHGKLGRKSV